MKTFKQHIDEVRVKFFTADDKDKYVSDEIKKRKLAKHIVNATDDRKMKKVNQPLHFQLQAVQW